MPTMLESIGMIKARNANRAVSRLKKENLLLLETIDRLQKQNEIMKEALEWYVEERFHYKPKHGLDKEECEYMSGHIAEQAIKDCESV